MNEPTGAERLARKDRTIVLAGLAVLALLAWAWLASGAGTEPDMAGMAGMAAPSLSIVIAMWWVMMIAMMLPSAAPAILLYGRVRRHRGSDPAIGSSWLFVLGYLLAWLGFSLIAAGAQWALVEARQVDAMALRLTRPVWAGALLIAAGLYQLSPLKLACLRQCRSPAQFISRHWRPGAAGALRLGLLHGAYCVGCCWLLMALLFVGGAMNLALVAALAALVAVEKVARVGPVAARVIGVALILGGAALVAFQPIAAVPPAP